MPKRVKKKPYVARQPPAHKVIPYAEWSELNNDAGSLKDLKEQFPGVIDALYEAELAIGIGDPLRTITIDITHYKMLQNANKQMILFKEKMDAVNRLCSTPP